MLPASANILCSSVKEKPYLADNEPGNYSGSSWALIPTPKAGPGLSNQQLLHHPAKLHAVQYLPLLNNIYPAFLFLLGVFAASSPILISRLIAQIGTQGKFGRGTAGGWARRGRRGKMSLTQLPCLN